MKNLKKLEEIFSDKVALPLGLISKTYEIIYNSSPEAGELKGVFKGLKLDPSTGGVILTYLEDQYLITSDVIEDLPTYRVAKIEFPEDSTPDTPYSFLSPAYHIPRYIGDLITYFYNQEVLLEFTDFWGFPDSIADPLYDHFKKYPFLRQHYLKS